MKNIINMYAMRVIDGKLVATVWIRGMADEKYFICQVLSPLTGEPNVSKLLTTEDLKEWYIIEDSHLVDYILEDYLKKETWGFGIHF